jgi:uncharacterized OsmC-like protein
MATKEHTQTMNGVDVESLVKTIEAVKDNPQLAQLRFHAETEWLEGARAKTRIKEIHQAGQEASGRKRDLELEGDEPGLLLGDNTAPNAVETVLHALTSCLAVGLAYNAAARGIKLEDVEFRVDGDMDLRPFLGIETDGERPGYEGIRISYRVKSDAPRQEIEELCKYVQETSPVMDIIRNPVPVHVELE